MRKILHPEWQVDWNLGQLIAPAAEQLRDMTDAYAELEYMLKPYKTVNETALGTQPVTTATMPTLTTATSTSAVTNAAVTDLLAQWQTTLASGTNAVSTVTTVPPVTINFNRDSVRSQQDIDDIARQVDAIISSQVRSQSAYGV